MRESAHLIELRVSRIALALGIAIAGLAIAGVGGQVLAYRLGLDRGIGLVREFNLDAEQNVPTAFAALLLLAAAVLLFVIASWKRRSLDPFRWHWTMLAWIFLLMSIDEAFSLHERLIQPMRDHLGTDGWLYFGWVIPGAIFVTIFGLAYFRFLRHLARPIRVRVAAAGTLYVTAALGIESLGGRYASAAGMENLTYALITSAEESLELVAIGVFVVALFGYMAASGQEIRFRARAGGGEPREPSDVGGPGGLTGKPRAR